MSDVIIRAARASDTDFCIPLVDAASGGVWTQVWRELAVDESMQQCAARYLNDEQMPVCIPKAVIAANEQTRLGVMFAHDSDLTVPSDRMRQHYSAVSEDLAQALRPYAALVVPNSYFIAELGCAPESRGQGVGTMLIHHAHVTARTRGLTSTSLRVFSANAGAVRLYQRCGFEVVDSRPVVAHPAIRFTGEVLLMRRPVDPGGGV